MNQNRLVWFTTLPLALWAATAITAPTALAGPIVRRAQERRACQEFAGKLQAAQGNPAQAQQIYAMGSQKLSGMFGPNPCPNVAKP
jgi:hypothetical protein